MINVTKRTYIFSLALPSKQCKHGKITLTLLLHNVLLKMFSCSCTSMQVCSLTKYKHFYGD
jgi:hypothetical protein